MLVILTEDEMLFKGLQLVGFNRRRMENVKRDTNIERFKAHYGSIPFAYAQIWEDLQTTDIPEARIHAKPKSLDRFLMAIHWLTCYQTERRQEATFKL